MKSKQLYFLLIGLLVLSLAGLFGLTVAANKLLGTEAQKLSKLRADSEVADALQTALAKNKKDIQTYSSLNQVAQTIVPQDKDQAEAVREIVKLAAASGISKLSSVTFQASTLGTIVTGKGATNPNLSQLVPVKDIPGLYNLPIVVTQTATSSVPYSQLVTFLQKLEQNRRTAQVTSITIQPNSGNPKYVAFSLVINGYIKP